MSLNRFFCEVLGQTGIPSRACVACLALCMNGQDQRRIDHRQVAIQGHVTLRLSTDHQLSAVLAGRAADQRAVRQHVQGVDDLLAASLGVFDVVLR